MDWERNVFSGVESGGSLKIVSDPNYYIKYENPSGQGVNPYTACRHVGSDTINLSTAAGSLPATHQVDAFGRRVMKRAPDGDTVYHYDPEGRLSLTAIKEPPMIGIMEPV